MDHTTEFHEALKLDPVRLAVETSNPRNQCDEDGTVMWVWRDCNACGSSVAVTVEQERAVRVISPGTEDA